MSVRWLIKSEPEQEVVKILEKEVRLPNVLAKVLAQRGVKSFDQAKEFFRPRLQMLHNPFLMKDMDKAVERILFAIENQEKIMVYGDYDVDGTTSVALMYSFLQKKYKNIIYYIPDRYLEGYGVSKQGVDFAKENGVSLIIALDCGIKAIENIAYAKENHIDFIVCDHHLPGDELPDAIAVLDPKRRDCKYPYEGLSGCGVGFKLIQALSKELEVSEGDLFAYLDLVCVSIAADIVPITGENRILAHHGIKILNENPRLGLKMLIPNEQENQVNISKIVFSIAPKINAAGRIKHATDAVKLLISENELTARGYVSEINSLNSRRKDIDAEITEEAIQQIIDKEEQDKPATVVYNPKWHKGVIGIVASRLTDEFYRPTVVFTKGEDNFLVASVRSVREYDVYEALNQCSDLLERYGGHMYAAGLTMQEVNFPNFKRRFEQVVENTITKTQKIPTIEIDSEIKFSEVDDRFVRILKQFEPFGPENMTPQFLTKNVLSAGDERTMGKDNNHLKLNVYSPGSRRVFTAVGFGFGELLKRIKKEPFDMVYIIQENFWQGKSHLQLNVKDIRFY